MSYKSPYIDIPEISRKARKEKAKKVGKTTPVEVSKTSRKYTKTRGEHYKDIVIAVLVSSVVSFMVGMHFCNQQQKQVDQAVKAAQTTAEAKK